MRPFNLSAYALAFSLGMIGCSGGAGTSSVPSIAVHPSSARAMPIGQSSALCPAAAKGGPKAPAGVASCHALRRTDITANASLLVPASILPGLQPTDLQTAYGLTGNIGAGTGQTVAVVVAYDNPALASDLAVYRNEFRLPSCTVANGCLSFVFEKKVKPSKDPSWAAESDLDVDMVSAICPQCKIVVAEAASNQIADLAAATGSAVAAGATEVSNSYSVPEDPAFAQYASVYNVPGVPMTAGAGDSGYGTVAFPASLASVTAVGGTSLVEIAGSAPSETVWGSTGSGCSALEAKPSWQTDSGCAMRTNNDVAVVGDPATGVATYMSALGGWNVFGGTSVGAPIVAAMYALAGNGRSLVGASNLYANPSAFRAVLGSSGTCSPSYLCNGGSGFNGPAGLGAPTGLAAF